MKVLIIGATGTAGMAITKKALSNSYELVALVRNPDKLKGLVGNIEIIKGDILDVGSLSKAIQGVEIVVSCVGAMDNSPGQIELFKKGMGNIIEIMNDNSIKRLISINGALTKVDRDNVGFYLQFMRWLIPKLVPQMVKSNKAQYDVIAHSQTDWTVIRAGKFIDKKGTGKVKVDLSNQKGFNIAITKDDLANFVIGQFSKSRYIKKSPLIFSQ